VKLKALGLPLPASLGIFKRHGRLRPPTPTQKPSTLAAVCRDIWTPTGRRTRQTEYVGSTDPKNPELSPIYADLHGLPPTLFIAGGRDYLSAAQPTCIGHF